MHVASVWFMYSPAAQAAVQFCELAKDHSPTPQAVQLLSEPESLWVPATHATHMSVVVFMYDPALQAAVQVADAL